MQELNAAGHRTKRGKPFDKGVLYKLLNNRTYVGEVEHKGTAYPGEHEALVDRATWDKVHAILAENRHRRASHTRAATPALLKGLIFGPDDRAMAPSHTRQARQALPVLSDRDQPEALPRRMPDPGGAGGRGRGGRDQPGPCPAAGAGGGRPDVARGLAR